MEKITVQQEKANEEKAKMLLQLHIAEYNMLTTRHTYFLTLQYGLISVLLIFLTIIASIWDKYDHSILIWIAFSVAQLFAIIVTTNIFEINNIVKYMESVLRKSICDTVNDLKSTPNVKSYDFLKFEQYQTISQNSFLSRYFELILFVATIIIFIGIIYFTFPFKFDYLVLCSNILMLLMIGVNTVKILKLRYVFSKIHKMSSNED